MKLSRADGLLAAVVLASLICIFQECHAVPLLMSCDNKCRLIYVFGFDGNNGTGVGCYTFQTADCLYCAGVNGTTTGGCLNNVTPGNGTCAQGQNPPAQFISASPDNCTEVCPIPIGGGYSQYSATTTKNWVRSASVWSCQNIS